MALAADVQRERTVAALRRYYVEGRLDAEELARRTDLALRARTTAQLRRALRDLPWLVDAARGVSRGALVLAWLVLLGAIWALTSLILLILFVVALATAASAAVVLAIMGVWLAVTGGTAVAGRRRLQRR